MPAKKLPQKTTNNLLYLIIIALILTGMYLLFNPSQKTVTKINLSTFKEQVAQEQIRSIEVKGNKILFTLHDGTEKYTIKEPGATLSEILEDIPGETMEKIEIEIADTESDNFWTDLLLSIIPFLLIVGFFIFIFRQAQSSNNQALSFGKSKARLQEKDSKKSTFEDVAGAKEAKEELIEIVDFLKNPGKYTGIGAKIPKGVILVGQPGTGKCVTGETLILTNKGLLEIQNISKYFPIEKNNKILGAKIMAFNQKNKKNAITTASHWYNLGKEKTLKLKTQLGIEIEGTYEHPIIVLDDKGNFVFRKISEIKKGDMAVIKYNTQLFGAASRIPDTDTAYLIGLLIGDGGLTVKGKISFTTKDKKILQWIKKYFWKRYRYKVRKTSGKYDWTIQSKPILKNFFEDYGLEAHYAEHKKIPEWIAMAPKNIVKAFLQGLFDTDATTDRRIGTIQFSSASEKLLKQTHVFLLNFGIVNRIFARKKIYNGKLQYYLEISGDFLRTFQKEIGFGLVKGKKELLRKYIKEKKSNTNTNLIFNQKENIQEIWNYLKKNGIEIYKIFKGQGGLEYKNIIRYIKGTRTPSLKSCREFMKKTLEIAPSIENLPAFQNIASIVFSGFYFSPITAIEKSEATVYDFTVPKYHSFVANGLISHNTLLARAVAGEADVPFFNISGSEFVEMFVGVGASRVRDLFKKAKRNAPCIVFIDEIDAVGRQRGAGLGGGHDEREQTLNQILTEMDGFEKDTNVIVMAATNRPDVLDPALLRPGRFDRRIVVDIPDIKEREEILQIHSRGKPLDTNANLESIARQTPGFSGADIENLMNEAAILAAKNNQKTVKHEDIEHSIEKVMMGPERKSRVLSKKEKEITAFHEAGHSLVAHKLTHCDPVHKVSIISRGMALGVTWMIPEEDKHLYSKSKFEDELCSLLGGYMAEKFIFGEVTTGASNDLERASKIARRMVNEYGMSELGPIIYGDKNHEVFLGRDFMHTKNYSEEIAAKIDEEVRKIIEKAYKRTEDILKKNKKKLEEIAKKLLKKETLNRKEFLAFFPKKR